MGSTLHHEDTDPSHGSWHPTLGFLTNQMPSLSPTSWASCPSIALFSLTKLSSIAWFTSLYCHPHHPSQASTLCASPSPWHAEWYSYPIRDPAACAGEPSDMNILSWCTGSDTVYQAASCVEGLHTNLCCNTPCQSMLQSPLVDTFSACLYSDTQLCTTSAPHTFRH